MNNRQLLGMADDTDGPKGANRNKRQSGGWKTAREALTDMYLTILSRYPTPEEADAVEAYFKESGLNRYDAAVDTVWALLNTKEFIYRH